MSSDEFRTQLNFDTRTFVHDAQLILSSLSDSDHEQRDFSMFIGSVGDRGARASCDLGPYWNKSQEVGTWNWLTSFYLL